MRVPDRQSVIDKIVARIEARERGLVNAEGNGRRARSPRLKDETILKKLRNSPNAEVREDLEDLWADNWEGKYTSQSEADRALCRLIGYYTQDEEQIDRIFQRSGLYRADKWGRRSDYRKRTIRSALSSLTKVYQEPKRNGSKLHHDHAPIGRMKMMKLLRGRRSNSRRSPPSKTQARDSSLSRSFCRKGTRCSSTETAARPRASSSFPCFRPSPVERAVG